MRKGNHLKREYSMADMLQTVTEAAKLRVEALTARYHKEIFSRMADQGLNPFTDGRIRELDQRLTVLESFGESDYQYLTIRHLSDYVESMSEDENWARDIWNYILDTRQRSLAAVA